MSTFVELVRVASFASAETQGFVAARFERAMASFDRVYFDDESLDPLAQDVLKEQLDIIRAEIWAPVADPATITGAAENIFEIFVDRLGNEEWYSSLATAGVSRTQADDGLLGVAVDAVQQVQGIGDPDRHVGGAAIADCVEFVTRLDDYVVGLGQRALRDHEYGESGWLTALAINMPGAPGAVLQLLDAIARSAVALLES